jgi:Tol biopolymer transport system component
VRRLAALVGALVPLVALAPARAESPQPFVTIRQGIDDPFAVVRQLSFSRTGRFVAFVSRVALVGGDPRGYPGVYVLDRETGQVTLESASSQGCQPGHACGTPRLSGDGRILTFETSDDAPAGVPPHGIIVVKDRRTGAMRRIGPTPSGVGSIRDAAISADGRVVAFSSSAADLVPGTDANGTGEDVYSLDLASNRLQRLSVDSTGRQPSAGASFAPSISGDGRYVAFSSTAPLDGTRPKANGRPLVDVFLRDTRLQTTKRISARPDGGMTNGSSYGAAISEDGRFVALVSEASDLVKGDGNRASDVFVYDLRSGSMALVSRGTGGRPANGASSQPAISADGSVVIFQSDASDLMCGAQCPSAARDINLVADVFAADRASGTIWRVSTGRTPWMEASMAPAIDGSGTIVAFSSRHACDGQDEGDDFDLFVGGISLPVIVARK